MGSLTLFAQTNMQSEDGSGATGVVVALIAWLVSIIAFWRVFEKAGKPGWAAIIPIYNLYIILKIANRPGWWLVLYIIPIVNVIIHLIVAIDVAKAFGKSTVFGVIGLWLFNLIGFLILGFGNATYKGLPERPAHTQPIA